MTELITSAITGLITLLGVIVANGRAQAVTDTKLEALTREVREHNNFARRVPLLELRVERLERSLENETERSNL